MTQSRQTRHGLPAGSAWHLRLRDDQGSTLVEATLSIGILVTLVIGIAECCLMVYSYHFISNAAREGARYAIVRGSTWANPPWNNSVQCATYADAGCTATADNIQDYVRSLSLPGIDSSQITVTTNWYSLPGGTAKAAYNAAGDFVQVQVQYAFPLSIPGVPQKTFTMSSTSMMTITQ